MAPHQQRVVDEKSELDKKLHDLSLFIDGNMLYNGLSLDEKARLRAQEQVMVQYSAILGSRIAAFPQ